MSTRRVNSVIKAQGIDGMGKSQVFELSQEVGQSVTELRERLLNSDPYKYMWVDALVHKCGEG